MHCCSVVVAALEPGLVGALSATVLCTEKSRPKFLFYTVSYRPHLPTNIKNGSEKTRARTRDFNPWKLHPAVTGIACLKSRIS